MSDVIGVIAAIVAVLLACVVFPWILRARDKQ